MTMHRAVVDRRIVVGDAGDAGGHQGARIVVAIGAAALGFDVAQHDHHALLRRRAGPRPSASTALCR